MKPPIRVEVRTDNASKCTLRLYAETPDPETFNEFTVEIPSDGNVYAGLCNAREGIEHAVNQILASNGIFPTDDPPEGEADSELVTGTETGKAAA